MNRQKELENAARRIKALKELTNKYKVSEKLAELEKETAWKRKGNQTTIDNIDNDTLTTLVKFISEKSFEIAELGENLKNKKVTDLVKIEQGLKDIESTLLDFSKKDEDVFFEINSKLNKIKDLRLSLKDDINWKKINELKQLVNLLDDAKLIIIKIQIDEEPHWPFENVD